MLDASNIWSIGAAMRRAMNEYSFTVIASGLDPSDPEFENRFFEAGCDDATIAFQKGVIVLAFDRRAKNLIHAIKSAVADVRRAGAKVEHVEPDQLVSLSDIAERTSLTRAAISLWSKGKRGDDDFPLPVARVATSMPLWDWLQVARWLFSRRKIARRPVVDARIVGYVNEKVAEEAEQEERLRA